MTGNTNKWRAPLAGLASLAMVATMGVAATTANAAGEARPEHTVTFTYNGKSVDVKVKDGASTADALHGYNFDNFTTLFPTASPSFSSTDFADFAGWNNFDFRAPVTSNLTVSSTKYNAASNVTATVYVADDLSGYSAPDGAKTDSFTNNATGERYTTGFAYKVAAQGTLGNRVPVDKADSHLVTAWDVYQQNGKTGAGTRVAQNVTDLSTVNVTTASGDFIVLVPAKTAATVYTLTVKHEPSTADDYGYAIGAYADGTADADYTVNVAKDQTVKLPGSWVNLGTSGYVSPNGLTDGAKDYAFGSDYTVSGDVTLTASDATTTSYAVTFLGADGSPIRTYRATDDSTDDLEGVFLAKTDREDISKITIPNFVVKGWKLANASDVANVEFTDGRSVTAETLFSATDFDVLSFKGNVTFTPVQGGTTGTVKVTFRDANYVGKHDTVVVDAKGGEYLSSDKFPTWTRDGYVLSKWVLSDGNGTPVSPEQPFTKDSLIGDGYFANNFTVVAVWEKVDATVLDAALEYIKPATAKAYFTAETYGKFNDVYTKVSNEKKQLEYASSNNKVSDADAAKLVTELKAGWEQLKFNAEGNPTISALDFRKNPFVFRLHKDGLRLYSQTPSEIYAAQKSGWTVDNGYLFRGAPKAASKDSAIRSLVDFTEAAKVVSGSSAQAELAKKLDAIADPIVDTIYRYSSPNGTDWVYTSNTTEMKSLDRGGWNNEGIAFVVPTFGGTPVVRFAKGGQHLMSTGATEQASLVRNGWTREGVAFRGL